LMAVGASPTTGGRTTAREVPDVAPCDAVVNPCARAASSDGGPLSLAVERILGFLAQTGMTLLPWMLMAAGLALAGTVVLEWTRVRAGELQRLG
jgi:hypothetical protein